MATVHAPDERRQVSGPLPPLTAIGPAHAAYTHRALSRLGVGACDRDDLAQEVLLAAARSGSPLEPQALLSGIARNLVLRWRGRMGHRLRADGEWWTATSEGDPMPDAEEQVRAAERAAVVHEAIRGLPDIFREVFVRCEVDGADMSEVAREIGIPVNTGYNRLRLARAHFREAVKRILARWRLASGDL